MKLYTVTAEYLHYIHDLNKMVLESMLTIGFIMRQNGFIYFVPIEQKDENDYQEDGSIKRSTPTIFRMIDISDGKMIGKCLLSNMFPVPYRDVVSLHLKDFSDEQASLFEKQNAFVKINEKRLQKAVGRLYKQKTRNYDQPYLKATLDFQELERGCLDYEIEKYGRHLNRFPNSQYFIVNPYQTGETEYYFMNQREKIAKIRMNNETQNITSIIEIYKKEYAPLECFENGELTAGSVSTWFKQRGIPSWRDGLSDRTNASKLKSLVKPD